MDRLFTVCYLPMTLVFLLLLISYRDVISHKARIVMGFTGFVLVMVAVPLVRDSWTGCDWYVTHGRGVTGM